MAAVFKVATRPLTYAQIEEVATWCDELRLKPGEQCQGLHGEPCNGNHRHRAPRAEWCPRSLALDRRWDDTVDRLFYKWRWEANQQLARAIKHRDAAEAEFAAAGVTLPSELLEWNCDPIDLGTGASAPGRKKWQERLADLQAAEPT